MRRTRRLRQGTMTSPTHRAIEKPAEYLEPALTILHECKVKVFVGVAAPVVELD